METAIHNQPRSNVALLNDPFEQDRQIGVAQHQYLQGTADQILRLSVKAAMDSTTQVSLSATVIIHTSSSNHSVHPGHNTHRSNRCLKDLKEKEICL